MSRLYSLAYLTSEPLAPPAALRLARKTGYQAVGVRIAPAAPGGDFSPLIDNPALLAETLAAIGETGVPVFDVEIVRIGAGYRREQFLPFLETAGRLGARAILVAGDDRDETRLIQSYAAFCEDAAAHGLTADLEFMPWTAVPDAKAAMRIVAAAAQPAGRILVDALHVARSATSPADIAAIPRGWLSYVQLCDAPAQIPATTEGLIHTARCARLLPGDGGIDLAGLLEQLPADLPISLEIPNHERLRELGHEEWARLALAAARRLEAVRPLA